MKIVNPFGRTENVFTPMSGCTCSSGSAETKSSFLCLGSCSCQCSCAATSSTASNKSANYDKGDAKHFW